MTISFSYSTLYRILLAAALQILFGYFTLLIQAIYPVWSSPFWPASGAALASVMLGGGRMLWGVYLGLLFLGFRFFWGPYPLWMAAVLPLGNVMETGLAYILLRHSCRPFDLSFGHVRQVAFFILLAPWLPALLSSLFAQGCLRMLGTVPPERFLSEVAVYMLGNATGILIVTPFLLVWRDFRTFPWRSAAGLQIALHLGGIFAALTAYFAGSISNWSKLISIIMIPLVMWGIWTTGIRGATVACVLASIFYFAFDVPGARPLSYLLAHKQKSAELAFALERKLHAQEGIQPPPRLAREIVDQIGLLTILCITILPLGVAADELRAGTGRDRMAMQALGSSFWSWTRSHGNVIENAKLANYFLPWAKLFLPDRKSGILKIRPGHKAAPVFLSHWVITESDEHGQPLRANGILQDISMEEERDTAQAKAREAELEIQSMRTHLNPHLLFNCLTGLRGLIATDTRKAREFTGQLARFLRATVETQFRKTIPLSDELAICRDFARLEDLRGRPLRLIVEPDSPPHDFPVPPLALLTLVENAAKHGQVQVEGPMTIRITLDSQRPHENRIEVRQPGSFQLKKENHLGMGLALIRNVLDFIYGGKAGLTLAQEPPGVVVATLVIPR